MGRRQAGSSRTVLTAIVLICMIAARTVLAQKGNRNNNGDRKALGSCASQCTNTFVQCVVGCSFGGGAMIAACIQRCGMVFTPCLARCR
uniref:Uncharacterized protein n=1 Tax=Kalanchoe fedtschenkoi TaxID=63787 RepID=A0A7N0TPE4_KALFE